MRRRRLSQPLILESRAECRLVGGLRRFLSKLFFEEPLALGGTALLEARDMRGSCQR
jgi:hypothetical protein